MIKGVIFDCFGVLYRGSFQTLQDLVPLDRKTEIVDLHQAKDHGYITYEEFVEQVGDLVGLSVREVMAIIAERQILNRQLMDYALSLRKSLKIALLSNIDDVTFERLFEGEAGDTFDAVVLSYQEGTAKPDPNIFLTTAHKLGLKPEECIMVDDLLENCQGAEMVGMRGVFHTDNALTMSRIDDMVREG